MCLHIRNTQRMKGSSVGVGDGVGGCHEVDGSVGCGTGNKSIRVCILGVHIVVRRTAQRGVSCVVRIMCAGRLARLEASCR